MSSLRTFRSCLATCAALLASTSLQAAIAFLDGTTLRYHAGGGEANVLTVDLVGADLVIHDSGAAITAATGDGFTLISANEVTLPASAVTDLEIRLQDLNDSCTISAAIVLPASIQGDEGDDTIIGGSGDDVIRGGLGNNWENGGAGYDRLIVNVDGFASVSNGVELNTSDGQRNVFHDFEVVNIRGGTGNDIIDVRGMPAGATFDIEGNDGDDNLTVADGNGVARGGTGEDTVTVFSPANVTLTDTTIAVGSGSITLLVVERVNVRDNDDGHVLDASQTTGAYSLTLEGNGGNDTLITGSGPNATVGLYGKLGDDTYVFSENWGYASIIEQDGDDTLDFSRVTTPLAISLVPTGVGDGASGASYINFSSGRSIEHIIGGQASDLLIGADQARTWNLTANNAGNVGSVSFSSFEILSGGNSDDTFVFANGVNFSGRIDGDASLDTFGQDTLDWRAFTSIPTVTATGPGTKDGQQGTASNLGLGFDNINQLLEPVSNCPQLTDLGSLGGGNTLPTAINGTGQVVGESYTTDLDSSGNAIERAFIWDSITGIQSLGTLGGDRSHAAAINAFGQVVGRADSSDGTHAFIWDVVNGMQDLGTLGGANSHASAVNDSGVVMGYSSLAGGGTHAFVWDLVNGMQDVGTLGGSSSVPVAINAAGQVIGYSRLTGNTQFHAFIWDAINGIQDLGTLNGPGPGNSSPVAINNAGQVIGYSDKAGRTRAFIWDATHGMRDLGTLGGDIETIPVAINATGQVVGYSAIAGDVETHAFIWDEAGGIRSLGTLGGSGSGATAINDAGQVIGDSSIAGDTGSHPFIWDAINGMRDLGTLGANHARATAINNSGVVIGQGRTAGNLTEHVFIWDAVNGLRDLCTLGADSYSQGYFLNDAGHVVGISAPNLSDPNPFRSFFLNLAQPANESPTVSCPNPVTVGATSPAGASVNLSVQVTDPDGDALAVVWTVDGSPVQTDSVPVGSPTTSATVNLTRTFSIGTHTVAVSVSDGTAASVSCSTMVTVQDTTPPVLTCPANLVLPCSPSLLAPATFAATATDAVDPAPTITYSPPSGSGFPVGTTTVEVTARDASGNESTCSFTVTRAGLGFTGFLPPIGGADATGGSFANPLRTFKLKSTIPVKFTTTCAGSPVLIGVHTLEAIKWTDETTSATPIDATPTDAATTGNQFRLTGSDWHFNLDTLATGMSAGKWQLIATLADGTQHTAWIQIK